jgi:hypothetical protein
LTPHEKLVFFLEPDVAGGPKDVGKINKNAAIAVLRDGAIIAPAPAAAAR